MGNENRETSSLSNETLCVMLWKTAHFLTIWYQGSYIIILKITEDHKELLIIYVSIFAALRIKTENF